MPKHLEFLSDLEILGSDKPEASESESFFYAALVPDTCATLCLAVGLRQITVLLS